MNEQPFLSVLMLTYNHEKFIADAIKSILMQKTNFKYEIVIGEDFSLDKTRSIIKEYQFNYPGTFNLLLHTKNIGANKNQILTTKACKGKYIAILEGDDYWTDPYKLQKQVDFLEANSDYIVSYHDAAIVDELNNKISNSKLPPEFKKDFSSDELKHGAWILTLSMCFRNIIKEFPAEFIKVYNGDRFLTSILGLYGKGKYLSDIKPAAYRKHSTSNWSSMNAIYSVVK